MGGCLPQNSEHRLQTLQVQATMPSPSVWTCDEDQLKALRFFLQHANLYELPHMLIFDNIGHLFRLINDTDFEKVSTAILATQQLRIRTIADQWFGALSQALQDLSHEPQPSMLRQDSAQISTGPITGLSTDVHAARRQAYPDDPLYFAVGATEQVDEQGLPVCPYGRSRTNHSLK